MAVWYVNSRTPPRFWHPSQMACQIGCRAQISLPGPRSWNITRVDAETPWPVGKHTVRPDCALISTAHPVISARRPAGNMTPLILSALSLLWVCTFFCPARLCTVKVLYPVWTNFELKAKSKLDPYLGTLTRIARHFMTRKLKSHSNQNQPIEKTWDSDIIFR